MNLQRLNDFLTKGMIGVFISIIPFSLLTLMFPIFSYMIIIQMIVLLIVAGVNFLLTTYLLVKQIVGILDILQKQYEQQSGEYI
jgi:hypothetical protein